jgi:hypothetical protein
VFSQSRQQFKPAGTPRNTRERENENRKKIFIRILLILQRDLFFCAAI